MDACYGAFCWTPEQRALLPRRVLEYGRRPKAYDVDPKWIKDGAIDDDKGQYPWLHEYQQGGYEVCVLGSSLASVQACVEAYESGFQPVLVFLQDKVTDKDKDFTMRVVERLKSRRFRTGVLSCGFEVVITTSQEVKLQLQPDGEVRNVKVDSKVQRFDVTGKPVDYSFLGPALLIDNLVDASMADDELEVDSLAACHQRVLTEGKVLTSPEFWERRSDPECKKFATPTFGTVIPVMLVIALQWGVFFTIFGYHKEDYFVFLRSAAEFGHRVLLNAAVVVLDFLYYGLDLPLFWIPFFVFPPLALFQLVNHLLCFITWGPKLYIGEFLLCMIGVTVAQYFLIATVVFFSNVKLRLWQLFWAAVAIGGTAGSWLQCMPIMLLYQLLLRWNGIVASVYLSVALAVCEMTMVKYMVISYTLVANKRKENPLLVRGDQKLTTSFCISCTHCFFETTRLISLVCGGVGATDFWFLRDVVVSLITSTVMNTAFRTGIISNQLIKIPRIGHKFCPNGMWLFHNNVKFSMGWCRYFNVLGLLLCRGFIHGRWRVEHWFVEPGDEGVWCWSGVVLITMVLAFCGEVLEDFLVYRICLNSVPLIKGNVYKEVMAERLNAAKTASRTHIVHYMVPPPVTSRVSGRHSLHNDEFVLAPSLNAARPMPMILVYAVGTSNSILVTSIFALGLGVGNMFGFCRRLNLETDDFMLFLKTLVVWQLDCEDLKN